MNADDQSTPDATLLHSLVNELAAIRSAAEILRDMPELQRGDRKRFAAAILSGEKRLETLIPHLSERITADSPTGPGAVRR